MKKDERFYLGVREECESIFEEDFEFSRGMEHLKAKLETIAISLCYRNGMDVRLRKSCSEYISARFREIIDTIMNNELKRYHVPAGEELKKSLYSTIINVFLDVEWDRKILPRIQQSISENGVNKTITETLCEFTEEILLVSCVKLLEISPGASNDGAAIAALCSRLDPIVREQLRYFSNYDDDFLELNKEDVRSISSVLGLWIVKREIEKYDPFRSNLNSWLRKIVRGWSVKRDNRKYICVQEGLLYKLLKDEGMICYAEVEVEIKENNRATGRREARKKLFNPRFYAKAQRYTCEKCSNLFENSFSACTLCKTPRNEKRLREIWKKVMHVDMLPIDERRAKPEDEDTEFTCEMDEYSTAHTEHVVTTTIANAVSGIVDAFTGWDKVLWYYTALEHPADRSWKVLERYPIAFSHRELIEIYNWIFIEKRKDQEWEQITWKELADEFNENLSAINTLLDVEVGETSEDNLKQCYCRMKQKINDNLKAVKEAMNIMMKGELCSERAEKSG